MHPVGQPFIFKNKVVNNQVSNALFQIIDRQGLWGWMRKEFLPNIYSQPWYNGIKDEEDVYVENKMSILIGMPWMRQLRIQKSERNSYIL